MFDRWREVWRRFTSVGTYPHELAPLLLIPLRRVVFSPEQLIEQLHLTPSSKVLEVGPGPGYFSRAVARALPTGRLELLDVQHEMLVKARKRLSQAGLRAGSTQASADTLPYQAGTFDAAFLVAVLGEVPDSRQCVVELARVLRRPGLLVIVELPGDPDALTATELQSLAVDAGLTFVSSQRVSRATVTTFRSEPPS